MCVLGENGLIQLLHMYLSCTALTKQCQFYCGYLGYEQEKDCVPSHDGVL